MNVLVLYSADDVDSAGVATYYADARSLPPDHLCGLEGLLPTTTTIDVATYKSLSSIVRAKKQPEAFHRADVKTFSGHDFTKSLFIVSALDGFDYTDAKALVDRAVTSEGTLPKAEILCMHAEDEARGARDPECEFAIRMLTSAGFSSPARSPTTSPRTARPSPTSSASAAAAESAGSTAVTTRRMPVAAARQAPMASLDSALSR